MFVNSVLVKRGWQREVLTPVSASALMNMP